MRVEELEKFGVPKEFVEKFKTEEKISDLYPPQADIIRKNLLKEKSLVVSMPTAGGKTLIAALAMLNKFNERRCKAVYIAPLVALANEKYEYFKKLFDGKYKVALSVGDFDSTDRWLSDHDVIVCTTEKLDSLIRHGTPWTSQIGLIVVDEIHLLNDASRGPTLEILLTILREISPNAQILGLSATIKNSNELAKWLNANLLVSDFRPVKLYEGVSFDSSIQLFGGNKYSLTEQETEIGIVKNTLSLKKQALFFVSTRKNAEALAENLSNITGRLLSPDEKKELGNVYNEVLGALDSPTKQCKRLASCVINGAAFHHAGLVGKQKKLIEENFRKGLIKVITSTPTLALGVNLPAFRVVIRDAKRYYDGMGMSYIPVLEYKQMTGRAGRPQYDSFGEAILVAKSEDDADDLVNHFIHGDVEDIYSKLAVEPILRMHTLSLVASGFVKTEESLFDFFSKTFYAFQFGDITAIKEKLLEIIGNFVEWGLVEYESGKIYPTRIGKRVSELYLDPLTAHNFIDALNKAMEKKITAFSFVQTACNTLEMQPLIGVRAGEFGDLGNLVSQRESEFLQSIPEEWDLEFEDFFKSVKTAVLFEAWLDELTEDEILTKFKVAPGELRNRLDNIDWLIFSMNELGLLLGHKDLLKEIRKTRVRLKYGIKEELLPLVKLEQIGRIRARKLYNANLKTIDSLKKIPMESLSKIVGPNVARIIKKQVELGNVIVDDAQKSSLPAS